MNRVRPFLLCILLCLLTAGNAFGLGDWALSQYSVSPTNMAAGTVVTLRGTVKNLGDTAMPEGVLNFTLHDYELSNKIASVTIPPLAPGATASALTVTWTVPELTNISVNGFYLNARVAPSVETTSANNLAFSLCKFIPNASPDLAFMPGTKTNLFTPDKGVSGLTFTNRLAIYNVGNRASQPTRIKFWVISTELANRNNAAEIYDATNLVGSLAVPVLDPGRSTNSVFLFHSPTTMPQGFYQFLSAIDPDGETSDVVRTNNGLGYRFSINGSALADLTATNTYKLTSSSSAFIGGKFSISLQVANLGKSSSIPVPIHIFFNQGSGPVQTAEFLVATNLIPTLKSGQSSVAFLFDIPIPANAPVGTNYFISYQIDPDQVLDEVERHNNAQTVQVKVSNEAADLQIVSQSAEVTPASGQSGTPFTVRFLVKNTGVKATSASKVVLYLNRNSIGYGSNSVGQAAIIPALAVGATSSPIVVQFAPASSLADGNYYLSGLLDSEGIVPEINENNNRIILAGPIPIHNTPELSAHFASLSASVVVPLSQLSLQLVVTNASRVAMAKTSQVTVSFKPETGDASQGVTLGTLLLPKLSGNGSVLLTTNLTIPATVLEGKHVLSYLIDSTNGIVESVEGDNSGEWMVVVSRKADLLASLATLSPSVASAGGRITTTLNIQNQGYSTSPATTVRFFFGALGAEAEAGVLLGSLPVSPIAAQQTVSNLVFTFTVPQANPSGSNHVWYSIEPVQDEGLTINNRGKWTLRTFNGPDLVVTRGTIEPNSITVGGAMTFNLKVVNQGAGASPATTIGFYLAEGQDSFQAANKVGQIVLPALASGEEKDNLLFTFQSQDSLKSSSNYHLTYFLDETQQVEETSEINNQAGAVVSILKAPDLLSLDNGVTPAANIPGGSFSIRLNVRNGGALSSKPCLVNLFFSSMDSAAAPKQIAQFNLPTLAVNASQVLATNYVVSSALAPGQYRFFYAIDADAKNPEANEDNNNGHWDVVLGSGVDLVASAGLSSDHNVPGGSHTVKVTVKNNGNITSPASQVAFFLARDAAEFSSLNQLSVRNIGPLAPQASLELFFDCTFPSDSPLGNYIFSAWIDPDLQVVELDKANNKVSTAPVRIENMPDLAVVSGSINATNALVGGEIVMSLGVKNIGTATAAASKLAFYLQKNSASFDPSQRLAVLPIPSLEAGQTLLLTYTNLLGNLAPGNYVYSYFLDAEQIVPENNELNNQSGYPAVNVRAEADLFLGSSQFSPSPSALPGQSVTFTVSVGNRGSVPSKASVIGFFMHPGQASFELPARIGEVSLAPLASGQVVSNVVFSHTLPLGMAEGTYVFSMAVDPENVGGETFRENNIGVVQPITVVRAPDLRTSFSSLSASTLNPGSSVHLIVEVSNQGSLPSVPTQVAFFFRQGAADFHAGTLIGSRALPALAVGQSARVELDYELARNIIPGQYSFAFEIDQAVLVGDMNRANNLGQWPVEVLDAAELVAQLPVLAPTNALPGAPVTISLQVANEGNLATPATRIAFYRRTGDQAGFTPSDYIGESPLAALAPGDLSALVNFTNLLPSAATQVTYSYWIDPDNTVMETDLDNNRGSWTVAVKDAADLVVASSVLEPLPGDSFNITLAVSNIGSRDAAASTLRIHLHKGSADFSTDTQVGEIPLPPIPAHGTVSALTFAFVPPIGLEGGNYQFSLAIDPDDLVPEIRENNNQISWPAVPIGQAAPLITERIAKAVVRAGDPLSLPVKVSGKPLPTLQWFFNGQPLSGQTSGTLTLEQTDVGMSGEYFVVASNSHGSITSDVTRVSVLLPPITVESPQNQTAVAGREVAFRYNLGGSQPIRYRWSFEGRELTGIPGDTLTLSQVTSAQSGRYDVVASNAVGQVAFGPFYLTVIGPPSITSGPTNLLVQPGNPALFRVVAAGGPLSYQWLRNGTPITDATNDFLLLNQVAKTFSGSYSVRVKNAAGEKLSNPAILTVGQVEAVKPTLVVGTMPTRVTQPTLLIKGIASDNVGVSRVIYALGNGDSALANGTTNWSVTLQLQPGTNFLAVASEDSSGNLSAVTSRPIFYSVAGKLILSTNGLGSITRSDPGILEIGKRYSFTATAASGSVFGGWTGDVVTNAEQVSFLMKPQMTLRANFVRNSFLALKGTYNGLFRNNNGVTFDSAGFCTLALTDKGTYSASLKVGTVSYPFTGRFDIDGRSVSVIKRGKLSPLTNVMTLNFRSSHLPGQITGTMTSSGGWRSELVIDQVVSNAKTRPAPQAGIYNLVVPPPSNLLPITMGSGFLTLTVDKGGLVNGSLMLADGSTRPIPFKSTLSAYGDCPIYLSLYSGKGLFISWVSLTNSGPNPARGSAVWMKKPAPKDAFYRDGFSSPLTLFGSRYVAPAAGVKALALTGVFVDLTGGNLEGPLSLSAILSAKNTIDLSPGTPATTKLKITVKAATGTLSGTFVHPKMGKTVNLNGILLQNSTQAFGFFYGTNATGNLLIQAPAQN